MCRQSRIEVLLYSEKNISDRECFIERKTDEDRGSFIERNIEFYVHRQNKIYEEFLMRHKYKCV